MEELDLDRLRRAGQVAEQVLEDLDELDPHRGQLRLDPVRIRSITS